MAEPNPPVVDQIPPPEIVRAQLSRAIREAELLRQLLRLSERKQRDAEKQRAKAAAGGEVVNAR